jgi:pimeloyl-ACP methyl ester carboxylesterase
MTPTEQYIEVNGYKLFVQQRDTACDEAVIWIHGNSECSYSWEPVWNQIPEGRFHLIAYDMPGHGYSERDWKVPHTLIYHADVLTRLMKKLHLQKPVTLVGHSQGGGVSLTAAIFHPERVKRLILINSVAKSFRSDKRVGWWRIVPTQPRFWFRLFLGSPMGKRIVDRIMRSTIEYVAYPMVPDLTQKNWKRDMSIWANYRHIVAASEDMRQLGSALQAIENRFSEIQIPVDIVAGAKDQLIPFEMELWLHQQIPGSKFYVLEEGGHMCMTQFPNFIASLISGDPQGTSLPLNVYTSQKNPVNLNKQSL